MSTPEESAAEARRVRARIAAEGARAWALAQVAALIAALDAEAARLGDGPVRAERLGLAAGLRIWSARCRPGDPGRWGCEAWRAHVAERWTARRVAEGLPTRAVAELRLRVAVEELWPE